LNIEPILVTLEVSKVLRSRLTGLVALYAKPENIPLISVTLEVSKVERSRFTGLVGLYAK
jgi:hypothetical protein